MPRSQLAPNTGRAGRWLAWQGVSGPPSPACATRHNLQTWETKKETSFLPAPHTYQSVSRTGRDSCEGAKWYRRRSCAAGEGNTLCHRRWRKGWGKDLKREGRGSHVMPSDSTAEPPTNANPQSVLCTKRAKSLRDSHWLPQEGSQQNNGASLIFPKPPLTLPSSLFPDLCGLTDPLYFSMWTTTLNSATTLEHNLRKYCPSVWEDSLSSRRNFICIAEDLWSGSGSVV